MLLTKFVRILLILALGWTSALRAQVVCPTLPAQSAVASSSPDDIPPTNVDIITHTGAIVKARANHNIVFVSISPTEQQVWFGVDASPGLYRTFYNRRVRDFVGAPWRWLYSYSPEIIQYQAPSSSGPAAVLYSDTPKYRDAVTNTYYKYIMYQGYQPGSCDGQVAGFLYVGFSNDGICWTSPREVHPPSGGPWFDCYPGHFNTIPTEQVSAVDGGDKMYLISVEGDIHNLVPPSDEKDYYGNLTYRRWSNMQQTLTNVWWASYANPQIVNLANSQFVSWLGMYLPRSRTNSTQTLRYAPYAYFMNLQMAYDAASGYLYLGRGYPYGYDRGSFELSGDGSSDPPSDYNVPSFTQLQERFLYGPNGYSLVEGCLPAPYTLPNRIQVYKMYIGSLSNIASIVYGTWTLVADLGGAWSYTFADWSSSPIQSRQTNVGHDFGAVSFLRDRNGYVVRNDAGQVQIFGAHTYKQVKSVGPCRITGLEREVLMTIP